MPEARPKRGWRELDPLPTTLVVLTATTGMVDAVTFLGLGQTFAANMTGNVALLGFAVAGDADRSVGGHLTALAAFVLGVLAGGRIGRWGVMLGRRRWLLITTVVTAVLLVVAAVLSVGTEREADLAERWLLILLLALAMGFKAGAIRPLGVADLNTAVVTTTLTSLVVDSTLTGGDSVRPARRVAAIVALFVGAAAGALLLLNVSMGAALVTAGVIGVLVASAHALHPGSGRKPGGAAAAPGTTTPQP